MHNCHLPHWLVEVYMPAVLPRIASLNLMSTFLPERGRRLPDISTFGTLVLGFEAGEVSDYDRDER